MVNIKKNYRFKRFFMECDFLEKIKKLDFFIKCARLSVFERI